VVKLLDYARDVAGLEANNNPFATVMLAHLKAQETRHDPASRRAWKMRLVKGLLDRGLAPEDIRQLFRFIDWLLELPAELEQSFRDEVYQYEQEKHMPFITSIERLAMEKGRQEGRQEGRREGLLAGIRTAVEVRFGDVGLPLMPIINELAEVAALERVLQMVKKANSVEELRRQIDEDVNRGQ
jgi:flagellar biosynthesis/type III secretory pathway protein FliH